MERNIKKSTIPEERELNKYREQLKELEKTLAEKELILETLKSENRSFENKYLKIVGVKYAELDEIEARIAELMASSQPDNINYMRDAEESRKKADESAEAGHVLKDDDLRIVFKPTENIKKLYRDIARLIHPDLGNDENREKRQEIMSEVNKAYEEGDEERLKEILKEWKQSEGVVEGEGVAYDLVRLIRKIARIEDRIKNIDNEMDTIKSSDLYKLQTEVEDAQKKDRDLLQEMVEEIQEDIDEANKHLNEIDK